MQAWAKDQGTEGTSIRLVGDPHTDLTAKLGMVLDHDGPRGVGLVNRCKRVAMYVNNCKIKILKVAEKSDDPAGDEFPEVTLAEQMIKDLDALPKQEL